ncbi:Small GTPase superfamily [Sesbania bispinosa]|nr:Small GTPase superfamily [Sesbania bispinosa]
MHKNLFPLKVNGTRGTVTEQSNEVMSIEKGQKSKDPLLHGQNHWRDKKKNDSTVPENDRSCQRPLILLCSVGTTTPSSRPYLRLPLHDSPSPPPTPDVGGGFMQAPPTTSSHDTDSDLVNLKISLLGDCHIGKTSFVIKYVGDEQEKRSLQMNGLNLMDKTLFVQGARISFSIWDVAGDKGSLDQIPMACKDAVAILIMFDLTSRCTLNR